MAIKTFLNNTLRRSLCTKKKEVQGVSPLQCSLSGMLLITAVLLLNWHICHSQTAPDTTISTNSPYTKIMIGIPPIILWGNIQIVHAISNNWGIALTGRTPWTDSVKGYGVDIEVRRYFRAKQVEGWYGSGIISYGNFQYLDTIAKPLSVGAMIGSDVDIGQSSLMSFGFGLEYFIIYDPFHANHGEYYPSDIYAMNGRMIPNSPLSKWAFNLRIDIGFYWVW